MELFNNENNYTKKRRRTKNTSPEQYEIYLNYLESDYVFRSNTINPTLSDTYLKDKWNELAEKLNSIGQGPCLSAQEWMKRFTDWKNSTRAKYRKIGECRLKTGGGPEMKIELTPFEERGLACWGKVTVEGSKLVEEAGGLNAVSKPVDHEYNIIFVEQELDQPLTIHNESSQQSEENIPDIQQIVTEQTPSKEIRKRSIRRNVPRMRQSRYETIAKDLISSCNSASNTQDKLLENKNNIEKEKLRFEVEKFKFQNPNFKFDLRL